MPELPEVETTRRGIEPHIHQQTIARFVVRQPQLRWPIEKHLTRSLKNQVIRKVERRAKYLLLTLEKGALIIHLGMSGSLRILQGSVPKPEKHDHFDVVLENGDVLRYTDPRRFGACVWQAHGEASRLLDHLGPEPLSEDFNGAYLYERSRKRKGPIKTFIMDQKVVVGVGNIYASEALFLAGIRPTKAAGSLSKPACLKLTNSIKTVLDQAIQQGGTTLKDFVGGDGKPGYFAQSLNVYGRAGLPCPACERPIQQLVLGQRSTFFCVHCQKS